MFSEKSLFRMIQIRPKMKICKFYIISQFLYQFWTTSLLKMVLIQQGQILVSSGQFLKHN